MDHPPSETWFGDLSEDDVHDKIEAWEDADKELAIQGHTRKERERLWRMLNPATPVLDWHADLVASGMDPEEAQAFIVKVGEAVNG